MGNAVVTFTLAAYRMLVALFDLVLPASVGLYVDAVLVAFAVALEFQLFGLNVVKFMVVSLIV